MVKHPRKFGNLTLKHIDATHVHVLKEDDESIINCLHVAQLDDSIQDQVRFWLREHNKGGMLGECNRSACNETADPLMLNTGMGGEKYYCKSCANKIQESADKQGLVLFPALRRTLAR